ncbi:MAG: SBBP repeat-containing protein [Bacteroidia bacterium]|nr:SBBP repeat-containing protein [Bacteroidia bacterium]
MTTTLRNLVGFVFILPFLSLAQVKNYSENKSPAFTTNKGQVCDEHFMPRHDILYSAFDGKLTLHLKKSGLEYHLLEPPTKQAANFSTTIKRYRLDVNWKNCNTQAMVLATDALPGVTNYYQQSCGKGALAVKSFETVLYTNLYEGIQLRFYQHKGSFKYDYELSAGSDYKKIVLQYKGAESLSINSKGDLLIKTALGTIVEEAPTVMQNGVELPSKWLIHQNEASFFIEHLNPDAPFIIDPVARQWGSFYGGNTDEYGTYCTTDANGNVYLAGTSNSFTSTAIASVGAHQTTLGGQGANDAFVAKFNAAGVRQWATLYGGAGTEDLSACVVDASGNVYLSGRTNSGTGTVMATSGAHQSTMAPGGTAAYLVKFDNAGVRQWGTYYGGLGNTQANGCCLDPNGNVYISGNTNATVAISTPGAHQQSLNGGNDGFLAKFNSAGVRQWATYYGDTGGDNNLYCAADASANVFLCGSSATGTLGAIASASAAQTSPGSTIDPFVAKFNANGVRQWGTFCGGTGAEQIKGCATDPSGNIFVAGLTSGVSNALVTSGAHQTTFGGNTTDGFLMKLDGGGQKLWGTYYGDNTLDQVNGCSSDATGNVYITGIVTGGSIGTAIATTDGYEPTYVGGVADAYLAKFNPNGVRQWGTYYGGMSNDNGMGCAVSPTGEIYLCGSSTSINYVTTPNSHQFANAGMFDAFLVKFFECAVPSASNTTAPANLSICYNNSTILSATGTGTITWYSTPTLGNSLGSGTTFTTPALLTSTVYYAENTNTCAASGTRIAIPVTVNPKPNILVSGIANRVCKGTPVTINVSGANSYTWSPSIYSGNSILVTPLSSMAFTISGSNSFGCLDTRTFTLGIHQLPVVNAQASPPLICEGEEVTLSGSGALSYTWSSGSNSNPDIQLPLSSTVYTVTGTDANNCTNTATVVVTVDVCEGLNESSGRNDEVMVYPNPAKNSLTIYNAGKFGFLEIFSALGQRLVTQQITTGINNFDVSGLTKGCYLIHFRGQGQPHVPIKLIIE